MERHKVHQYQRDKLGKSYLILRCTIPGCTHYIPLTLGQNRECLCYRCRKVFILAPNSIRLKRPHCGCQTKKGELRDIKATSPSELLQRVLERK